MSVDEAKQAYRGLDDEQRARVEQMVEKGWRRRAAVGSVIGQNRAYNLQEASDTAETMTTEPSRGDTALAAGMGAADALAPAAEMQGVAAGLGAPVAKLTGSERAGKIAGGAMMALGGIPMLVPAALASRATQSGQNARAAQQEKSDELIDSPAGAAYAAGNLGANVGSAATGLGGSAMQLIKNPHYTGVTPSSLKSAAAPVLERLKGAGRELTRETLDGGGQPTKIGMLKRAVKAIRGEGGVATDDMIEGSSPLVLEPKVPGVQSLADDIGDAAPSPSGLTLERKVPVAGPAGAVAPEAPSLSMTREAEMFDEGAAAWNSWRHKTPPPAMPRPDLEPAAQVMSTSTRSMRTPATPAQGAMAAPQLQPRAPAPPQPDMPADVMAGMAPPKLQPKPAPSAAPAPTSSWTPEQIAAFQRAEAARSGVPPPSELPPAPPMQVKRPAAIEAETPPQSRSPKQRGAPTLKKQWRAMGDAEQQKTVRDLAKSGIPLGEAARRLGVPQKDIAAMFKAAQLGA
jgi:hypothetical protein